MVARTQTTLWRGAHTDRHRHAQSASAAGNDLSQRRYCYRLLHVEFDDKLVGKQKTMKEGSAMDGVTVQDLSKHPKFKGADPHVHMEVYGQGTKGPQDPMPYLRNEHKTNPTVTDNGNN